VAGDATGEAARVVTAIVTRGDAADLHLPDETVDLVVTSPPYFGLRSYTDGGVHYEGQVGDEATPAEYLDALIACTAEWVRVLKPGGSLFVDLGDKYAGGGGQWKKDERPDPQKRHAASGSVATGGKAWGYKPKTLIGLPWRYALRCIDDLGLILRAEIIWSKPNGLPESVTDRVRRSHEQVFHLVKSPRYYTAVDEIREAADPVNIAHHARYGGRYKGSPEDGRNDGNGRSNFQASPLGKLPGSVWSIPTAPLTVPDHLGVDHFAAFPPELVRRIILGWSPREVCCACGEGRRPSSTAEQHLTQATYNGRAATMVGREDGRSGPPRVTLRTVAGYVCGCPDTIAPARPGIVLDPFGGTGTTALVASVFGRVGISVDLSADYCRLATWRTTDPGERARALDVPKPERPVEGQLDMFDGLGA
jgi:DNA modification methylase